MFNSSAAREARLDARIDITTAAAHVRVSASTLSRWERGDGEPSFSQGLRLANLYKISPHHLLAEEGA